MDKITIKELEVFFHVGVPDGERAVPQRLLITVELTGDFSAAAAADDLTRTIDYYAVTQRVLRFGEGRTWKLIEKLADDIARMALAEFAAKQVVVEVKKFIIPQARYVSVRLNRAAEPGNDAFGRQDQGVLG
jgi:dihydroneopterin aldolase